MHGSKRRNSAPGYFFMNHDCQKPLAYDANLTYTKYNEYNFALNLTGKPRQIFKYWSLFYLTICVWKLSSSSERMVLLNLAHLTLGKMEPPRLYSSPHDRRQCRSFVILHARKRGLPLMPMKKIIQPLPVLPTSKHHQPLYKGIRRSHCLKLATGHHIQIGFVTRGHYFLGFFFWMCFLYAMRGLGLARNLL